MPTPHSKNGLVQWRVVIRRRGKYVLNLLELDQSLPGSDVSSQIMGLYYSGGIAVLSWLYNQFHSPVAEIAVLEWVDSESHFPCRVTVISRSLDESLTEGCNDPSALVFASEFAGRHPELLMGMSHVAGRTAEHADVKAILVRPQLTKGSIFCLMACLLTVLLVGLFFGTMYRRVDIAVGVMGVLGVTIGSFKILSSFRIF